MAVMKRFQSPTDRAVLLNNEGRDSNGNPIGREELTLLIARLDTTPKYVFPSSFSRLEFILHLRHHIPPRTQPGRPG